MRFNHYNTPLSTWPKMPQAVNEVAERLHQQYGEEGIPSDVLKREIELIGEYRKDSVIPSDYCYNVVNKASYSFRHLVLLRVKRGRYKYVGPAYDYEGPILWKPKQMQERQVGIWHDGLPDLETDPRL